MSLQGKIFQNVLRRPDQVAIQCGARELTYQRLEEESNHLAHFLAGEGGMGKRILVALKRSPELIAALLGILKSGDIFVPLDPNYPERRQQMMMEETKAQWIILHPNDLDRVNHMTKHLGQELDVLLINPSEGECVDRMFHLPAELPVDYDYSQEIAKHCYIYFTSGSTGRPKGVLGRQRSLEHFIQWEIDEFGVNESDHCSQLTSPSFDPFLRDVFVPLCAGGTLCIPEDDTIIYNPRRLIQWMQQNQITLMHLTPSLFKPFAEMLKAEDVLTDLRYILLAGEKLRGNDVKRFLIRFHEKTQLVNLYGPTETTLAKFYYRIKLEDVQKNTIPVGKPIPMTEALVLNQYGEVCQMGDVGEVYIRTPFISSGYFNNPEMTQEVFIKNPFNDNPRDLLYKTGDLGRMAPDGNLELTGRVDQQVKIRGIRIEPGEIENHLLGHGEVKEAVVTIFEDALGEKELVTYYSSKEEIPYGTLRSFLLQSIPEYMLPGYYIWLPQIPMLPNGKVDKNSLPAVDFSQKRFDSYIAPATELEAKLASVWADVLQIDRVGVEDHFNEIGGHSLKAITLIGKIEKHFGIALTPQDIFKCATVRQMARLLEFANQSAYSSLALEDESSAVCRFNAEREKKLFFFPPIAGYGITYSNLAEALIPFAVYAFDFLENENRIEEYIRSIQEIQPADPYLLLGYSAGGSLAFEVAKAMEERGLAVSGIIMLDSAKNAETRTIAPEEIDHMVEAMIGREENEIISEALKLPGVREAVKRKIGSYIQHRASRLDTGEVQATIYYIQAEKEEGAEDAALLWQQATTQPLQVLKGYGSHEVMLEQEYLLKNVEILKHICSRVEFPDIVET